VLDFQRALLERIWAVADEHETYKKAFETAREEACRTAHMDEKTKALAAAKAALCPIIAINPTPALRKAQAKKQ
jgi:hypothetical protein